MVLFYIDLALNDQRYHLEADVIILRVQPDGNTGDKNVMSIILPGNDGNVCHIYHCFAFSLVFINIMG